MTKTVTDQAEALLRAGKPREALTLIQPVAAAADAPVAALRLCAMALRTCGKRREALDYDLRIVELAPEEPQGWLALGATLMLCGRPVPAAHAAEQARKLGADGPVTVLLQARALVQQGAIFDAEALLKDGLLREPEHPELHRELAQIVWMRTGDADQALAALDRAKAERPGAAGLIAVRASAMELVGRHAQAWAEVRTLIQQGVAAVPVDVIGADLALKAGDLDSALKLSARAAKYAANNPVVLQRLCRVLLAAGDAERALLVARELIMLNPGDQTSLALLATASRAGGGREAGTLYDYKSFVRTYKIETPAGWPTLEAFLADLKTKLDELHQFDHHPLYQSLRHGTQTSGDISASDEPVLVALFKAFDTPIREYMAAVGQGPDPVRAVNTGDYAIAGGWSARLKPNGFHVDHIHPMGWLSSAFYVETPTEALDSPDREGWIRFGQPEMPLRNPLPAEHYVRPEPGLLVLFPSYMWHGTVPFTTDEGRMTVAFDVRPL
ncbi:putative 2OG-Fe(II) oxygenase [Caulobacter sp. 17J65-9]|uniref:putative 2OG-Fe(II) oxygenase n=1 Tax=Caulobacter sp. 17J65-9 TaxID=2709382 RepID=UPI0013CC8ABC|nr:putative 2OG-Fe(II) oxygenase [Caulobacter sp. 17J65-9]NEX92809.1 tetratricopeptide repeat protein [Caulobacter sp. 17J65-9]